MAAAAIGSRYKHTRADLIQRLRNGSVTLLAIPHEHGTCYFCSSSTNPLTILEDLDFIDGNIITRYFAIDDSCRKRYTS